MLRKQLDNIIQPFDTTQQQTFLCPFPENQSSMQHFYDFYLRTSNSLRLHLINQTIWLLFNHPLQVKMEFLSEITILGIKGWRKVVQISETVVLKMEKKISIKNNLFPTQRDFKNKIKLKLLTCFLFIAVSFYICLTENFSRYWYQIQCFLTNIRTCLIAQTTDAQCRFSSKSQTFGQINFGEFGCFPTIYNHPFWYNTLSLYTQIPNIYLGLGFEFGPQSIRDLAIVCPQSVPNRHVLQYT